MKKISKWSFLVLLFAIVFGSCKKDENKIYFEGGKAPVLSANKSDSVHLALLVAAEEAVKISWTNPDYSFTTGGSSQDVTYTVQIDTVGGDFSGAKKVYDVAKDLSKSFTVDELNKVMINDLNLNVDQQYSLEFRVISSINKAVNTMLTSNVLTLKATPYIKPVEITYLYVPGDYQGWNPGAAPMLGSTDDKSFEGYVNFAVATTPFKFTDAPNWDKIAYGDDGPGKINPTGPNITFDAGTGYYQFQVNTSLLTWNYVKTDWGIVGAATPGGWDNSTPLVYDDASKTLMIASIALTAGEYKFRANNTWDINLGKDDDNPAVLKYGGGNFALAESGNYKVVLDLSHPPYYTYTLTKL